MLRGKIFLLFLIALMLIGTSKAMLVINEAMPNPASDWNSNGLNETYSDEWIEIYSDSGISLDNWILGDKVKNYTFHNTAICQDCFLVLYGNQMPIQLNNDNEAVFLYNENGTLADKLGYTSSSKDISVCKCESLKTCNTPTPNSSNACPANQTPLQNPGAITFSYPNLAFNNGTIFKANVTFSNFPPAMYDIKIEIKNQAANIAKILGNSGWVSSYYYLENKINISEMNDYQFSMKIDSDFAGNATIQLKIRNSTSLLESNIDNITIAQGAIETQSPSPQQTVSSTGNDSSLLIADSPSRASFGETINVDIQAYRGNTAKYAIYIYLRKGEDIISEKVSLHLNDKFRSYSFTVPLKINSNCNADYDEGDYDIVLEGMDKLVLKEITLRGNAECESEELTKKGTVKYKIDFPDEVQAGSEFIVSVKIYNNQNKRQQFSVWSYVYKDSNCYSCGNKTREGNAEQAIIESDDSAVLFLKNIAIKSAEGEYKLKVKVLREGYETAKDFTFDIFVKGIPAQIITQENRTNAESILNKEQFLNESQGKITGKVVYKAGKKSPITTLLLFLLLCVLLMLYFVTRRKSRYSKGADDFNETDKETGDFDDNEETGEQENLGGEEEKSGDNAETSEESGKGDEAGRSYTREIGEEPGENLKEESDESYKEDKEDENLKDEINELSEERNNEDEPYGEDKDDEN